MNFQIATNPPFTGLLSRHADPWETLETSGLRTTLLDYQKSAFFFYNSNLIFRWDMININSIVILFSVNLIINEASGWVWWFKLVILALERQMQDDQVFKNHL